MRECDIMSGENGWTSDGLGKPELAESDGGAEDESGPSVRDPKVEPDRGRDQYSESEGENRNCDGHCVSKLPASRDLGPGWVWSVESESREVEDDDGVRRSEDGVFVPDPGGR